MANRNPKYDYVDDPSPTSYGALSIPVSNKEIELPFTDSTECTSSSYE